MIVSVAVDDWDKRACFRIDQKSLERSWNPQELLWMLYENAKNTLEKLRDEENQK